MKIILPLIFSIFLDIQAINGKLLIPVFKKSLPLPKSDRLKFELSKSISLESQNSTRVDRIVKSLNFESQIWFVWLARISFIGLIITSIPMPINFKEKMGILTILTATLIVRDSSTDTATGLERVSINAGSGLSDIGSGLSNIGLGIALGLSISGILALISSTDKK